MKVNYLKELICNNCGGIMTLDASALTAVCQYCGTHYVLNHEDTDYYQHFYLQMCKFLSCDENERERKLKADKLWENADEQVFECIDGNDIGIKYLHKFTERDADVFIARKNIIFHFKSCGQQKAEQFRRNVSLIDYPSADTRQLSDFFPKIHGGFELIDGSYIFVIKKDEDEYPLRLFGKLNGRHVAWIISRLENLCCVLEFNSIVHPEINADTIFINPYTHQASLYGNWWNAGKNNTFSSDKSNILKMEQNLYGLRDTAGYTLGFNNHSEVKESSEIPKALADFIRNKPEYNAYDDFAYWDKMLIKAYGERKFIRYDTNDEQIYNKEQ